MSTKTKRPPFRRHDRVLIAQHVRTPIRFDGRPDILRDTVLRVWAVSGRGTKRDPWQIVCEPGDDQTRANAPIGTFWHFDPDDLVITFTNGAARSHLIKPNAPYPSVEAEGVGDPDGDDRG